MSQAGSEAVDPTIWVAAVKTANFPDVRRPQADRQIQTYIQDLPVDNAGPIAINARNQGTHRAHGARHSSASRHPVDDDSHT
jgi:hypothetical protein